MKTFTKSKFLSLPKERREKKRAELLRELYHLTLFDNDEKEALFSHYNQLQEWEEYDPLQNPSLEQLSDRYHLHIKRGGLSLKEHRLLPNIESNDSPENKKETLPITVYLDKIRSAHNVGSIIRTAEAFSFSSIVFSDGMATDTHKQVKDSAMGAEQWIDCKKETLSSLPRPIIAVETSEKASPIYHFNFPESFTLVLGNEEYGCSEQTLKTCDHIVTIPLYGQKSSLNVANAFAITAAEIRRQDQQKKEFL